jgi:flagellar protein FlaG
VAKAVEQTAEAQAPSSLEALKSAARQIETYLKSTGRQLEFRVDDDTGRTVVSVRDAETGELIRQIPSEETLRLARALGSQPNVLLDLLA